MWLFYGEIQFFYKSYEVGVSFTFELITEDTVTCFDFLARVVLEAHLQLALLIRHLSKSFVMLMTWHYTYHIGYNHFPPSQCEVGKVLLSTSCLTVYLTKIFFSNSFGPVYVRAMEELWILFLFEYLWSYIYIRVYFSFGLSIPLLLGLLLHMPIFLTARHPGLFQRYDTA